MPPNVFNAPNSTLVSDLSILRRRLEIGWLGVQQLGAEEGGGLVASLGDEAGTQRRTVASQKLVPGLKQSPDAAAHRGKGGCHRLGSTNRVRFSPACPTLPKNRL